MDQPSRPLKDVLAEIDDPRAAGGKQHSLGALLALVCMATLCGYRSYGAMAEWGRHYGRAVREALGFTHPRPPSAATLHRVLRRLDRRQVEAVAHDGKRLRGSHKQGAPGTHLLSAVSQRLGLTVAQEAVATTRRTRSRLCRRCWRACS